MEEKKPRKPRIKVAQPTHAYSDRPMPQHLHTLLVNGLLALPKKPDSEKQEAA